MFALTVDSTNHLYISIQEVDGSGTAKGYADIIYPFHLKSMGVVHDEKYGDCIALDKTGGYGVSTGRKSDSAFLIPYNLIYSYNNTTTFVNVSPPPPFQQIYNDINACIKAEEGV